MTPAREATRLRLTRQATEHTEAMSKALRRLSEIVGERTALSPGWTPSTLAAAARTLDVVSIEADLAAECLTRAGEVLSGRRDETGTIRGGEES